MVLKKKTLNDLQWKKDLLDYFFLNSYEVDYIFNWTTSIGILELRF